MKKQPVALIIPGGLGTGKNNLGIPVLEQIIIRVARNFDLTVFQLFPVNAGYEASSYSLVSVYSRNPIIKSVKFFNAFSKIHKEKKFSVIHGFWAIPGGLYAVIIGKWYGIKSIISLLGGDAVALPQINYGQLRNPIYKKLILWSLNEANEVIALTQYLVNNVKKAGSTRSNFRIIPWGIDTITFIPRKKEMSKSIRFLHVANLHPVKDQETLLRSFKIISGNIQSHLTIIGVGVDEQKVVKLIEEFELRSQVTMLDPVANSELVKFYHQADVLLHTSLSEGQSEVVTEAMSCGVLVCGTKVGLMFDLPDCCITVDVGDYKKLAEECLNILDDQLRLNSTSQKALQWATAHNIDWTVGQISNLYHA